MMRTSSSALLLMALDASAFAMPRDNRALTPYILCSRKFSMGPIFVEDCLTGKIKPTKISLICTVHNGRECSYPCKLNLWNGKDQLSGKFEPHENFPLHGNVSALQITQTSGSLGTCYSQTKCRGSPFLSPILWRVLLLYCWRVMVIKRTMHRMASTFAQ